MAAEFTSATASPAHSPMRKIVGALIHTSLLLLSTGFYALIVLLAYSTAWAESSSSQHGTLSRWLQLEVGTMITIVRVGQGILSTGSSILLARCLLHLHWGMTVRRPRGIPYKTMLALSPTTLDWGALHLVFGLSSRLSTRLWGMFRICLVSLIWLSGMLLLFRTDIVTVYDTAESFEASVGTGPFQADYVEDFLTTLASTAPDYNFTVVPYTYYAVVHNLLLNPLYTTAVEPITCAKSDDSLDCQAYLLTGGLALATPFNPGGSRGHPLARIPETPGMHLEFSGGRDGLPAPFADGDCDVFASPSTTLIAVKLCVSRLKDGSLQAGLFVCLKVSATKECTTDTPPQKLTTTMSFFKRTATVLSSRTNLTIVQVSDLSSDPAPVRLTEDDVKGYRLALRWLLDFEAAGIPAPSSLVQYFWSARKLLNDPAGDGLFLDNFRGILSFPVWLFNGNNWGNAVVKEGGDLATNAPREFFRTVSVVKPYLKLRFDPLILLMFVAFQGTVLLLLWTAWLWVLFAVRDLPAITSFPLLDVAYKALGPPDWDHRAAWQAGGSDLLRQVERSEFRAKIKE